jgi:hypothetical protein
LRIPRFLKPNKTKRLAAEALRVLLGNLEKTEAEREHFRPGYFGRAYGGPVKNVTGILLCDTLLRDLNWALRDRAGAEFEISATRTILALHSFQNETGKLPSRLVELAPRYLETVPSDPWDGKPLRYSREKRILWSVGEDLEDEGGVVPEEEDCHWENWEPTVRIDS